MFFRRSVFLVKRRNIGLSLAGISLLGCLYSEFLARGVHVRALNTLNQLISDPVLQQHNIGTENNKSSKINNKYAFVCEHFCKLISPMNVHTSIRCMSCSAHPGVGAKGLDGKGISMPSTASSEPYPLWVQEAMNVTHEAFETIRSAYISELETEATLYRHKRTGLSVMSLLTGVDTGREMCFDIFVPTPPLDDRGCPHILEHSVLEGSDKYPSREGFSLLIQGGFNSFLNAFTYKDRTSYLFASINEKDFYNTADIYMDCFFRPSIRRNHLDVFKREAWHYKVESLENIDRDPSSVGTDGIVLHGRHISYVGIVYNEMKKAYSDAVDMAQRHVFRGLYSNSYKYDSGGDPEAVVKLEYPELIKFYEMYYGPKTATVFFHGPGDVMKRLDFVNNYLEDNKICVHGSGGGSPLHDASIETAKLGIKLEVYRDSPKLINSAFGASNERLEDLLFVGWLLDPQEPDKNFSDQVEGKFRIDLVDSVGLDVLEHLLIGTPESILYKALIKSELGKKVIRSGLMGSYKQSTFSVGLEGVDCLKFGSKELCREKFEKLITSTLQNMVDFGIKRDAIDASLNQIEFQMRELNTGRYPKGLFVIHTMQPWLQYGRDPFAPLQIDPLLEELRRRVFGGGNPSEYFQKLLDRHMLSNNHRVVVHMEAMEPKAYEKENNEKIAKSLMERFSQMTKEEVDVMEKEYADFKSRSEQPEDPEVLKMFPTLSLSDIDPTNELIPTEFHILGRADGLKIPNVKDGGEVLLLSHPLESRGIIYMDLAISLDELSLEDLYYLDLFTSMLKEAGTGVRSPEDMSHHISKNLGDLYATFSFMTISNGRLYDDPQKALGFIFVRAKCLLGKRKEMLEIMTDLLSNCNFSNSDKGIEILKRRVNDMQNSIINEGHTCAARRMESRFSVSRCASEISEGYEYLKTLKDKLLPTAEKDWSVISSRLVSIKNKLLKLGNLTINVTASADIIKQWVQGEGELILEKMKSAFVNSPRGLERECIWGKEIIDSGFMKKTNEVIVVPTKVNFVGMGGPLFDKTDHASGADSLVVHYLGSSYLWRAVRLSLGAYGVFMNLTSTGDVIFMSYADPNFEKTLQAYDNVIKALEDAINTIDDTEFLRTKIGIISSLDKPLLVDAKGFLAFKRILRNVTEEDRLEYRRDILNATIDCFKRLLDRLRHEKSWKNVCAVVNQSTAELVPSTFTKLYTT